MKHIRTTTTVETDFLTALKEELQKKKIPLSEHPWTSITAQANDQTVISYRNPVSKVEATIVESLSGRDIDSFEMTQYWFTPCDGLKALPAYLQAKSWHDSNAEEANLTNQLRKHGDFDGGISDQLANLPPKITQDSVIQKIAMELSITIAECQQLPTWDRQAQLAQEVSRFHKNFPEEDGIQFFTAPTIDTFLQKINA